MTPTSHQLWRGANASLGCTAKTSRVQIWWRLAADIAKTCSFFDRRLGQTALMEITECQVDVLLVEDDELIRDILGEALHEAGLDTVRSPTAEEALALMGADAPKVMVTDINLGAGMDGLALGREARLRFPGLPIVYISGRYAEVTGLRHDERFLPKPFPASALLRTIAEFAEAGPASLPHEPSVP